MARKQRRTARRIISQHRCNSHLQKILDLERYLDVLEHKPGALRGSTSLAQWKAQGRWPASYDRIPDRLIHRLGRQPCTRSMVELIRIGQKPGYEKLTAAVGQALDLGSAVQPSTISCMRVAVIRPKRLSDWRPQRSRGVNMDQTTFPGVSSRNASESCGTPVSRSSSRLTISRCQKKSCLPKTTRKALCARCSRTLMNAMRKPAAPRSSTTVASARYADSISRPLTA